MRKNSAGRVAALCKSRQGYVDMDMDMDMNAMVTQSTHSHCEHELVTCEPHREAH